MASFDVMSKTSACSSIVFAHADLMQCVLSISTCMFRADPADSLIFAIDSPNASSLNRRLSDYSTIGLASAMSVKQEIFTRSCIS